MSDEQQQPIISTYRARRRVPVGGGRFREGGKPFPEGNGNRRNADRMVGTGHLEQAMMTVEDFLAAVEEYIPEGQQRTLLDHVGLERKVEVAVPPDKPAETREQGPVRQRRPVPVKQTTVKPAKKAAPGKAPAEKQTSRKRAGSTGETPMRSLVE